MNYKCDKYSNFTKLQKKNYYLNKFPQCLPDDIINYILKFLIKCTNCNIYDTYKYSHCTICNRHWCFTCIKVNSYIKIRYCYHSTSKICNHCVYTFQTPMMISL